MKILSALFIASLVFGASCEELFKKYNTPDPSHRTMKQLKRWVKNNLKNVQDRDEVLECLLENAADNPNQETIAGE